MLFATSAEDVHRGGEDRVRADERQAVRRVAYAPHGGTTNPVAGAAGQLHAHDPVVRAQRTIPCWIGWTKNRDHWCAYSTSQMHRSGIAGHQHVEPLDE